LYTLDKSQKKLHTFHCLWTYILYTYRPEKQAILLSTWLSFKKEGAGKAGDKGLPSGKMDALHLRL
jgi:hypothetical protein